MRERLPARLWPPRGQPRASPAGPNRQESAGRSNTHPPHPIVPKCQPRNSLRHLPTHSPEIPTWPRRRATGAGDRAKKGRDRQPTTAVRAPRLGRPDSKRSGLPALGDCGVTATTATTPRIPPVTCLRCRSRGLGVEPTARRQAVIGTRSRAPAWQPHARSSPVGGRPPRRTVGRSAPLNARAAAVCQVCPVRLRACRPAAGPAEADGAAARGTEDLTVTPPPPHFLGVRGAAVVDGDFASVGGSSLPLSGRRWQARDMSGTSEAWQAQCHESDA